MLIIEVELLAGRYAATEHNDRSRAEWPPHPARFFSALVAALHDRDPVDAAEREALLWIEKQGAPLLDVDLDVNETAGRREVRSVFVPVNDVTIAGDPERKLRDLRSKLARLERQEQTSEVVAKVGKAREAMEKERRNLQGIGLLPERRNRQERTFPVIIPERASFAFLWLEAEPKDHLNGLRRLCYRVTRLGHSSSLVRCTIIERAIKPTLVPRDGGEYVLRIVGPGQLDRLEKAYTRHQAVEARVLPARPQRYGEPVSEDSEPPRSVFTDYWIVFERVGGHRPLASRGSDLAIALRRALIEIHGNEDPPTMLSGHDANGGRSIQPHVAFVPLPWVGHDFADGSVQGLSLVLPRSIPSTDREHLLRLIARWEVERGDVSDNCVVELGTPVDLGRPIKVRLRRIEVPSKTTLNAARWCKPSCNFVTATPIALDRHPGNLRSNVTRAAHKAATEAELAIADACERIGLPRPSNVSISLSPLLPGAQHVRHFAPWPPQSDRARRARAHAEIEFHEKVRGPVLLGAGRYFGLGLCLPVADSTASKEGTTS